MISKSNIKFFIVDDDIFCSSIYGQFLKNAQYTDVSFFINGEECLKNIHLNPDIVFLDYNMHELNGFEVLKKIKRFNPNIYIVMISSQESISTAVEALKYGAFNYIVKDDLVCERMGETIQNIINIQEELNNSNPNILKRILTKFKV